MMREKNLRREKQKPKESEDLPKPKETIAEESESKPDALADTDEPMIPEEWKDLPLEQLIDDGYSPRIKRVRNIEYIVFRKGNSDRSVGRFSPERWSLLMELFPQLRESSLKETVPEESVPFTVPPGGLYGARVAKPEALQERLGISLETLQLYEYFKSKGFEGKLGDFISECMHYYFVEQGLCPVIIIQKAG